VQEGRETTDINFFPNIAPIVGRTLEQAQAKHAIAVEYADWEGGLACVSGFTGLDLSQFPLDEPFNFEGVMTDNSVHTMIQAVQRFLTPTTTPRQLGKDFALCGFGTMPVGTPDMIANIIEEWINGADIDGFIVSCKFILFLLYSQKTSRWQMLSSFASYSLERRRGQGPPRAFAIPAANDVIDVSNPGSYEDFVELLVPVPQERYHVE
jgi:alkanesulfonate monooxygenase SsuD/methylene tetrahydromethanopterin reductase-like flavin-dependent oxidoreductase (luciferase family)